MERRPSRRGLAALVLAGVLSFTPAACTTGATSTGGAAPGAPCTSAPFSCPAGQTCSPFSADGTMQCLVSGEGQLGEECLPYYNRATCKDGLVCVNDYDDNPAAGRCVPFCSTEVACPNEAECVSKTIGEAHAVLVCDPHAFDGTGGPGVGGYGGYGEGGYGEGGYGEGGYGYGGAGGYGEGGYGYGGYGGVGGFADGGYGGAGGF